MISSESTKRKGVRGQMSEQRTPKMGEAIVYVDPTGQAHPALVTQPWGPTCVNLVYVTRDGSKRDPYGQQLERATSFPHQSQIPVHGNYWRFADEAPKATEKPA